MSGDVFYRKQIQAATKELYVRVKPELAQRLEELLAFYGAPSISQMIEALLEFEIKEMDSERNRGGRKCRNQEPI